MSHVQHSQGKTVMVRLFSLFYWFWVFLWGWGLCVGVIPHVLLCACFPVWHRSWDFCSLECVVIMVQAHGQWGFSSDRVVKSLLWALESSALVKNARPWATHAELACCLSMLMLGVSHEVHWQAKGSLMTYPSYVCLHTDTHCFFLSLWHPLT